MSSYSRSSPPRETAEVYFLLSWLLTRRLRVARDADRQREAVRRARHTGNVPLPRRVFRQQDAPGSQMDLPTAIDLDLALTGKVDDVLPAGSGVPIIGEV